MKLINDLNCSIIIPEPCNCNCSFCFQKGRVPDESLAKDKATAYIKGLIKNINSLPKGITQCSITGGEPSKFTQIDLVLSFVRDRFKKVVLSTNCSGFTDDAELFASCLSNINHLNISRHHYDDDENVKIFGNNSVPIKSELDVLIEQAHDNGVDVTLNCVLAEDFSDKKFIIDYIDFAREVNADAVSFRKEHGDLSEIPVGMYFPQKRFNETTCPVCKSYSQFIAGIKVIWKYSVIDPSKDINEIYEVIIQPTGAITTDWQGEKYFRRSLKKEEKAANKQTKNTAYSSCGHNPIQGCRP